jgi:hypothetical protein
MATAPRIAVPSFTRPNDSHSWAALELHDSTGHGRFKAMPMRCTQVFRDDPVEIFA